MAEQALYRKYRSADFSEVVGQEHVVSTLVAAVASGHISHAYLFTGPRGVGKTSVARLLARALNCTAEDGIAKPCRTCASCTAPISSSLDVIEIDAASNNGVDDVRELRDKINLAPASARYKVYIIDEVHMLSAGAFNALLKTLEEPPAHAIFILATTEAHKLPETIISRTQRFNFKPLTTDQITGHLATIAAAENIIIDTEALELIAAAARGGFRDAIGMLDQLAAAGLPRVDAVSLRQLLGYGDHRAITELSEAIADHDTKTAFTILARLVDDGVQPSQIAVQLTDFWRSVLQASVGATLPADEGIRKLAGRVSPAEAARVIEALIGLARSPWPALSLEAAIAGLGLTHEAVTASVQAPAEETKAAPAPRSATDSAPPEAPKAAVKADTSAASEELWPKALVLVKQQNNSLYALMRSCRVEFGDNSLILWSKFNFHRDRLNEAKNRTIIEIAIAKTYGRELTIKAQVDTASRPAPAAATVTADLVSQAIEILGGEVVE